MKIVTFNPAHLQHINLQIDQEGVKQFLECPDYHDLLLSDKAYTCIEHGRIVLCSGVYPMTDYMARAWALVDQSIGRALLPASRAIRDFLKETNYARIDTPVRRDFLNGHRWCDLLGFVNETPGQGMRYYGFAGETYDLYAFYPQEHNHHGQLKSFQET